MYILRAANSNCTNSLPITAKYVCEQHQNQITKYTPDLKVKLKNQKNYYISSMRVYLSKLFFFFFSFARNIT